MRWWSITPKSIEATGNKGESLERRSEDESGKIIRRLEDDKAHVRIYLKKGRFNTRKKS
jgi:hypothetical protein